MNALVFDVYGAYWHRTSSLKHWPWTDKGRGHRWTHKLLH